MRKDLLNLAAELSRRGEPYALATVVRREAPSSAHAGDAALVTADGTFHGWLGGSCTQPTVRREARRAIADGRPRLIALSPDPDAESRPGVTPLPMTCHSGGSVDIYIEPMLPAPALLVFGVSPAARALARIATVLGYAVVAVDPDADVETFPDAEEIVTDFAAPALQQWADSPAGPAAAVVATLGERDEESLQHALALCDGYVGLIASRRRFGEMKALLESMGVPADALGRVHCPAGLDLGAVTPPEIALTIMAEIVQQHRAGTAATARPEHPHGESAHAAHAADHAGHGADHAGHAAGAAHAPMEAAAHEPAAPPGVVTTDPVCGMTVDPATAKHRADHGGLTYLFCCGGCRQRFLAEPEKYLAGSASGGEGHGAQEDHAHHAGHGGHG